MAYSQDMLPAANDRRCIVEAWRYGQYADDMPMQLPKTVRDALRRMAAAWEHEFPARHYQPPTVELSWCEDEGCPHYGTPHGHMTAAQWAAQQRDNSALIVDAGAEFSGLMMALGNITVEDAKDRTRRIRGPVSFHVTAIGRDDIARLKAALSAAGIGVPPPAPLYPSDMF